MVSLEHAPVSKKHPAIDALDGNMKAWGVDYDTPDRKHYPHRFKWDLEFAAIVRANYGDTDGAMRNIYAVLRGQKESGLLPNMGFGPGRKHDFERGTFIKPKESSDYTQPPLLAHATLNTYKSLVSFGHENKARDFVGQVYPKLHAYHKYLIRTRTDAGSSLVAVMHPHETGRDSDASFDFSKPHRLKQPKQGTFIARGVVDKINTLIDYADVMKINKKLQKVGWDPEKAREIFWIKDVMFNTIYAENLGYMAELAGVVNQVEHIEIYKTLQARVEKDILEQMWNPETGLFHALDKTGKQIDTISVSNLFPVGLTRATKEQVVSVLCYLTDPKWFGTEFPVPTLPLVALEYDGSYSEKRIWRGPTWVNMNWYLTEYVIKQRDRFEKGDPELAFRLNAQALRIAERTAFLIKKEKLREFYDPKTGKGMRVNNFAWSTLGHLLHDMVPNLEAYFLDPQKKQFRMAK